MSREWKPGDVAELSIDGQTGIGVVRKHRDDSVPVWVISGHSFFKSIAVGNDVLIQGVRPLVVIDPEDREQVERLWRHYVETAAVNRTDALQAALREFANPTPPKPEEPTGLGAVVEDERGRRFTRYHATGVTLEPQPWALEADDDCIEIRYGWADISAVRILSEGVQP